MTEPWKANREVAPAGDAPLHESLEQYGTSLPFQNRELDTTVADDTIGPTRSATPLACTCVLTRGWRSTSRDSPQDRATGFRSLEHSMKEIKKADSRTIRRHKRVARTPGQQRVKEDLTILDAELDVLRLIKPKHRLIQILSGHGRLRCFLAGTGRPTAVATTIIKFIQQHPKTIAFDSIGVGRHRM